MDALLLLARYVLLAVVYLFIVAVVRAIQVDLRVAAAREEPQRASLVVEESPLPSLPVGTAFRLEGEVTVGRGAATQVTLPSEFASAEHARLFPRGGRYWIDDLRSKNGTLLNGRRLAEPRPLREGDRVRIGEVTLRFSVER